MQKSDTPGNRNTLLNLKLYLRSVIPAFLFILIAGITTDANAVPPGVPDFTNPNTRLVVIDDSAKADGSESNTVRAYVYDDLNNPVLGAVVAFTILPSGVAFPVVTNASGYADFVFVRPTVGQIVIDARIGATYFNPTATVTFVAFEPDADQSDLQILTDSAYADNMATNTVEAIIRDINGNPVPNHTVTFAINSGTASFVGSATVTTDANGLAVVTLISGTPGDVLISATAIGTPNVVINDIESINFVDHTPDPSHPETNIQITTNNAVADGADLDLVTATVVDNNGIPVAGQSVTFSFGTNTIGAIFTTPITVTTDINGVATISLSSTVSGTSAVTATVNGLPITNGNPAAATFVAGPPDLSNPLTAIIIDKDISEADGLDSSIVHVHIADQFGNPVANQTIVFAFTGTAGSGPLSLFTDANGNAYLKLASTTIGTSDVSATVNGTPLINGNPSTVNFVIGLPDVTVSTTHIDVVTTGAVANNIATDSVKATITDKAGHLIPGQNVIFSIFSGTGTFIGSSTVVTDVNGEAGISLVSTLADTVRIIATVNGDTIIFGSPATVYFIAGPPDPTNPLTALVIDVNNVEADGTATNVVRAHVVDQYGNPVPNQTIDFSFTGVATAGGSLNLTTDAQGNATLALTSTTVGSVDVSADLNGSPFLYGNPSTVNFVIGIPDVTVPTTNLQVVTTGAVANNIATNSVKATITDNAGHLLAGETVIFSIFSGTGSFIGTGSVITNINGEATISLVSTLADSVLIIATVNGDTLIFGSPAKVNFVPGPPDLTNPSTLITVIIDSSMANGTAQNLVIAHIVDQYGNPTPNQTVVFDFTGVANAAGPLTVTTNSGGNAVLPLTSTTIGSVIVTADLNGSPIINGNPSTVHFIGGEPDVTVPTTRLEVITTGAVADSVATNSVKAIITDSLGHPLQGETVIFKIFSGTGSIIGSGTVLTNSNGEAAISLVSTLADTVLIIAIVNGDTIIFGSPAQVYFVAGPPDLTHPLTVLVVAQDGAAADGVAQNILRAHIVDKYGNPVPDQTITFNYLGVATPGGPLTITTDPLGNATLSLTSSTVGPVVVTATVNGIPLINGNPSTVQFVIYADPNNPLTRLSTVGDNAPADGSSTNRVRAHVVDNAGNPMPGVTVVFSITSGDGTMVTPQTVTTDVNGDAYLMITSNIAGYVTITATADGRNIQFGSPARVRFTSIDVWVPKVFTPNGDGVNDMVRATANGITVQYFNIYNRWGNLLFTTPDISQGWDGRFKGVVQPNETYLWILVGRSNSTNERVQKRGMITLVK